MTQKRQTLNADKRKVIADVFQNHWEREDSPMKQAHTKAIEVYNDCLLYTSPSPRDATLSRMPSSA